jgi:hypothetical protein
MSNIRKQKFKCKSKKKINEREISRKEKRLKRENKSHKSSTSIKYNTNNNKSNESDFENIYKTILNGSSLKNLKINENNQIKKK